MLRQRLASNLTADKEAEIAVCQGSYEKLSRKLRAQKSCCFVAISVPASVANPRQGPSCIYRRRAQQSKSGQDFMQQLCDFYTKRYKAASINSQAAYRYKG